MLISVEAALDLEPGIEAADVVLTVGATPWIIRTSPVLVPTLSRRETCCSQQVSRAGITGMAGASYYSIRQGFISGDALAIQTVPLGPAHLATIETEVRPAGKLYRAIAAYAFPGPQRGGRLVAGEWKLIIAGGFYNRVADYAASFATRWRA
jgi:hypothetical protein